MADLCCVVLVKIFYPDLISALFYFLYRRYQKLLKKKQEMDRNAFESAVDPSAINAMNMTFSHHHTSIYGQSAANNSVAFQQASDESANAVTSTTAFNIPNQHQQRRDDVNTMNQNSALIGGVASATHPDYHGNTTIVNETQGKYWILFNFK